jgi:hypothetical protein
MVNRNTTIKLVQNFGKNLVACKFFLVARILLQMIVSFAYCKIANCLFFIN